MCVCVCVCVSILLVILSRALKAAYSVTMNIFEKFYFLFKSFVKVELSYVFTIKSSVQLKTAWKILSNRWVFFVLSVIICVPPIILDR